MKERIMGRILESYMKILRKRIAKERFPCCIELLEQALREQWEELPRGWDEESLRKFWNTLTGGVKAGEGGVTICIRRIRDVYPDITDAEAFCASLADRLFGKEWRRKARRESLEKGLRRRRIEELYREEYEEGGWADEGFDAREADRLYKMGYETPGEARRAIEAGEV